MKNITPERITVVIFWIGFLSFLSVSIPHVAWLYQQNETPGWYSLITSYGVAIGIDVLVAWLSYACARGKITDAAITVSFILLLSALSFYANYLFDIAHAPGSNVQSVWSTNILFSTTTAGYITPLIKSAIPFFALAYTFMLARLSKKRVDLGELEEQFKHESDLASLKAKYGKEDGNLLTSLIDKGKQAIQQSQTPAPVQPQITAPQPQATNEQNTDALEASQIQAAINGAEEEAASNSSQVEQEPKRDCAWYRSRGQTNLTVQETAVLCDTNEQVIKSLRTKTILKSPSPNSVLITLASIEAYLSGRKQGSRNRKQNTASIPVIESTTNEDGTNDTASLDRLLATASMPKYAGNGHSTKETVKLDELEVFA